MPGLAKTVVLRERPQTWLAEVQVKPNQIGSIRATGISCAAAAKVELPNGRLLHGSPLLEEFFLCCGVTGNDYAVTIPKKQKKTPARR